MSYYSSSRYPSGYDTRPRGYRVCDNCGTVESPQLQLKLCSQCRVTQYCSRECQKSHWKSHETICKHTQAAIVGSTKYGSHYDSSTPSDAVVHRSSSDVPPSDLAKHLRKFTSAHSALLGWAGFQALELKRMPSNIRKCALLIELSWRGGNDPGRRFEVSGTHILPLSYLSDPVVCADIQRREDRSRRSGGIGAAVVLLQCARISQVMPVEVDSPAKVPWATVPNWEDHLSDWIDTGRGEFTPPLDRSGRTHMYR